MDFAAPSSTLDRYRSRSSRCSQVSVAWSWQSPDLAVGDRIGLSTGAPRLAARCPGTIDPRGLGLPFRAARGLRDPSPVHTRRHGTVGPPLLASSASPLRRLPSVRLLPVSQLPKQRTTFGSGVPSPDVLFRPRGLSPPRRFSPHRGCGFVAPRYRPWGSSRFRRFVPALAPSRSPEHRRGVNHHSRDAGSTLRRVPLVSSCTASLRPFPSCRWPFPSRGRARLQGVAPLTSPLRYAAVSGVHRSLLPWASVPFEVSWLPLRPPTRNGRERPSDQGKGCPARGRSAFGRLVRVAIHSGRTEVRP